MTSDERNTRIPYRLGTDHYCKFKDRDEYVHMGALIDVCEDTYNSDGRRFSGYLSGVSYDYDGFISKVTLSTLDNSHDFDVAFDGVFCYATKVDSDD